MTRIAIVNEDRCACFGVRSQQSQKYVSLTAPMLYYLRCRPKKCNQECKKSCPVVKVGEFIFRSKFGWWAPHALSLPMSMPGTLPTCALAHLQASCAWRSIPTRRSHGSRRSCALVAVSASRRVWKSRLHTPRSASRMHGPSVGHAWPEPVFMLCPCCVPGALMLRAHVCPHVCANLQKCPFDAIMIINLPKNLEKDTTHRYGPNSFKLHRCGTACCSVVLVGRWGY